MRQCVIGMFLALAALLTPLQVQAQKTRVLLPISFPGTIDGALASRWRSELVIRNVGDEAVSVSGLLGNCPPFPGPCFTGVLPGHTSYPLVEGTRSLPATMLEVDSQKLSDLRIHLRIRDLSKQNDGAGTTVPVVKESDALVGPSHYLSIPLEPSTFRVTIRLYDFDGWSTQGFLLRLFGVARSSERTSEDILDRTWSVSTWPYRREGSRYDAFGYAELPLDLSEVSGAFHAVNLEISPHKSDLRYWGMVSVTSNQTQQVMIIPPAQQ